MAVDFGGLACPWRPAVVEAAGPAVLASGHGHQRPRSSCPCTQAVAATTLASDHGCRRTRCRLVRVGASFWQETPTALRSPWSCTVRGGLEGEGEEGNASRVFWKETRFLPVNCYRQNY